METADLPDTLSVTVEDDIALVRLDRPAKHNALSDQTVQALGAFFSEPPKGVQAAILHAEGRSFCAGLDVSELQATSTFDGVTHSRMWHRAFEQIEFGQIPVVSVLHGAVLGGGLELASATHVRVAEPSAYFALPEGQRGLFVGGGGSVRIPRLIGTSRMMDMMLTGRILVAEEAASLGLVHYLVGEGEGLATARELAGAIAGNSPVSNYAVMHVLPRIAEMGPSEGHMLEAVTAAVAQGSDEAKSRLAAFLEGRSGKVAPS